MPTITFSLKDLNALVGRKITEKSIEPLLEFAKAELEGISDDEITVKFNDTNLPYLWCAEGLAILFKGVLEKEKGIPEIKVEKSEYSLFVDKSVRQVRPFIAAFVAKGKVINEYLLKQLIQLQEKFCENYGRKRQKVAVGIYPKAKISFPLTYKAASPKSVRFVPLDYSKDMDLDEILNTHPKGKEFAWILGNYRKYPVLTDSQKQVLSFPPIINSELTGKLSPGDTEVFFEATGTDLESVNLACNIFAHVFAERGFNIESVKISYAGRSTITPDLKTSLIKISKEDISALLGIELKESEVKKLLEKARFDFNDYKITVPSFRGDIMHPVDIIEDIGIMHGYPNILPLPLVTYTKGMTTPLQEFVDKSRDLIIGLGYQEVMSHVLSSREVLDTKMNLKNSGAIEIANFTSSIFSAVRSWIIPSLMDVLAKNKHVDFPQKVFEQGIVSVNQDGNLGDYERIAALSTHSDANFTEVLQCVDFFLKSIGAEYSVEEGEHNSFIPGRVARIIVKDKKIAYVGEINPAVLNNWGLDMPVCGFEINLTDLFEALK